MATVDNDGGIKDEKRLFTSFDFGTVLSELKKYDDEHCIVMERYDGRDWLYVEDSEIFKNP